MSERAARQLSSGLAALGVALSAGPSAARQGLAPDACTEVVVSSVEAFHGYTLFSPLSEERTYLVDMAGQVVHRWDHELAPGFSAYLLEDGSLLRCGRDPASELRGSGFGGRIQRFAWDGTLLWDFALASVGAQQHHDIEPLPNGNVLAIAWELHDAREALGCGRDAQAAGSKGDVWSGAVLEIRPQGLHGGEVVWAWRAWDHRVQNLDPDAPFHAPPAEHPGRIDLNGDLRPGGQVGTDPAEAALEAFEGQMAALGYAGDTEEEEAHAAPPGAVISRARSRERRDWLHLNSVSYAPERDLILLSSRAFSEVWIIDHSTTTEEAAGSSAGRHGRGGDLLFRWGNPLMHGQGSADDRALFLQHDARWLEDEAGFTVFNNGTGREPAYSSVDEVALRFGPDGAISAAPGQPRWSWRAAEPREFYAWFISGAQRLPNGNTLVCDGPAGRAFEVTREGRVVWDFRSPFGPDIERRGPGGRPEMPVFRADVLLPLPRSRGSRPGADRLRRAMFRATRIAPDHPALRE